MVKIYPATKLLVVGATADAAFVVVVMEGAAFTSTASTEHFRGHADGLGQLLLAIANGECGVGEVLDCTKHILDTHDLFGRLGDDQSDLAVDLVHDHLQIEGMNLFHIDLGEVIMGRW